MSRLEEIKARRRLHDLDHPAAKAIEPGDMLPDFDWLIAEVERLRLSEHMRHESTRLLNETTEKLKEARAEAERLRPLLRIAGDFARQVMDATNEFDDG